MDIFKRLRFVDYNAINYDTKNINKMLLPVNYVSLSEYNDIMKYFNSLYNKGEMNRGMQMTKSGGISTVQTNINSYTIDCKKSLLGNLTGFQVIAIISNGWNVNALRIGIGDGRNVKEKNVNVMSGTECFKLFKKTFKNYGIDLKDYAIKNGYEVKKYIPKPMINMYCKANETYKNAYHLDINSSFPSAMIDLYPEWKEPIEFMYNKRKEDNRYKLVLNASYGYFQSKYCKLNKCNYALAQVSKHCLEVNNTKINDMLMLLCQYGCKNLATNTDGIWFTSNNTKWMELLKDTSKMGNFKLDHQNCIIRFKSKGSYEFIEDGKVNVVVRGQTKLDKIKPDRDTWEWGDIFRNDAIVLNYRVNLNTNDDEYGKVIEVENEEI